MSFSLTLVLIDIARKPTMKFFRVFRRSRVGKQRRHYEDFSGN
jgi:hypothetical protein